MNTLDFLFDWILAASLRASVLVLVVLAIRALTKARLPAGWRYVLWLPVLGALMLPGIPLLPPAAVKEPPQAAAPVKPIPSQALKVEAPALPAFIPETPALSPAQEAPPPAVAAAPVVPPLVSQSPCVESPARSSFLLPPRKLIAVIWLTGVVLTAGFVGASYALTLRRIRRRAVPAAPELLERIARLSQSLGLRHAPRVCVSEAVASSAVCGWWRPALLLNAAFPAELAEDEADMVLRHELTHIRRGDLVLNPLLCGLLALHWFNPLLWFAFFRVRADREAACDADVLRDETDARRAAYGQTLLKMETALPPSGLCLGFVGILQRGSLLRDRIQSILAQPKPGVLLRTTLAFGIVGLAVLGLAKTAESTAAKPVSPQAPFQMMLDRSSPPRRTSLDIRVNATAMTIAPVSIPHKNDKQDTLALPVRIENRSQQVITAEIAHEWYGGLWPPTSMGAAVRRLDDPAARWRVSDVFLVGELGRITGPITWQPGQSHDFQLRMNWPGTGSVPTTRLMDAEKPGKYAVKLSLVFKSGAGLEYCESDEMEVTVEAKASGADAVKPDKESSFNESPATFSGRGKWGSEVAGLSCRITPEKSDFELANEPIRILVELRNTGDVPVELGMGPPVEAKDRTTSSFTNLLTVVTLNMANVAWDSVRSKSGRVPEKLETLRNLPTYFTFTSYNHFPSPGKAKTVMLAPKTTLSEIVFAHTSWATNAHPPKPMPKQMVVQASVSGFLTPSLKTTVVESQVAAINFHTAEAKEQEPSGRMKSPTATPQSSGQRLTRQGDTVFLEWFATDDDLAQLDNMPDVKKVVGGIGVWDGRKPELSITDVGLKHLEGLKELEVLHLPGAVKLTDACFIHLAGLTRLREIRFEFNTNITGAGFQKLEGLGGLRMLTFHGAPITDAGFEQLKGLSELENLQLGMAVITDRGLAVLKNFPKLKTLDLQGTKITDSSLIHLQELHELEWLCLRKTKVTDAGLVNIKGLKKLQQLYLGDTGITEEGKRALKTALPKLEIIEYRQTNESPAASGSETDTSNKAALQQIQSLGLRDDTLSYEQQPFNWLWERREQLVAPLVAGLQSTNLETARQCLRLLDGVQPTPALADFLLQVASDTQHPLRAGATLSLCRFASEPRVMKLLESSWTNAAVFPDAGDRATLAEATGRRPEAAELLGPLLSASQNRWDFRKVIGRLTTNGTPAALSILSQTAQDKRWVVAAAARLALAKADPAGHALTAAQKEFLETAGLRFKESSEQHRLRCQKLAALPHEEIRPLLQHMLTTDRADDAAFIYGLSKDPEALPEIRRRALAEKGWQATPFIAAWLLLDESNQPINELLEKIRHQNEYAQEYILRAVAEVEVPPARQLAFFRAVRDQLSQPVSVARALARTEQPVVLATLFAEETNFAALGEYARWVARAPKPEFEKPLRRAVEQVANAAPSVLQASADPAYAILEAAASYPLKDLDAPARRLLDCPQPQVAIAAARLAAGGTHRGMALALLNRELGNPQTDVRQKAAENLLRIPCVIEEERRQREQAVLALLGQPAEDYALRVLTTCAGPQTTRQLEPRLDGTNLPAARYAAWVLAQTANPEIARKALRRLALHALFCHQVYQQGAGIDFEIAPDLVFHQSTGWLNLRAVPNDASSGGQIPSDLMLPTRLDSSEQTFLVRDYREVSMSTRQYVLGDYFMMFAFPHGQLADATYLPFFEVVAQEDPTLRCLFVQGRKVAHFPYRQASAQNLVRLTGKPATYPGLTGEPLAADQFPSQPYPEQDRLIARLLLDRIQAANFNERPATDRDWSRVGYFNDLIQHLTDEEKFGAALKDALLREAGHRKLDPALKNAGFGLWR